MFESGEKNVVCVLVVLLAVDVVASLLLLLLLLLALPLLFFYARLKHLGWPLSARPTSRRRVPKVAA